MAEGSGPDVAAGTGEGHAPPGATVWITGLPASGKSTLAGALARELSAAGQVAEVLDGDDLRRRVCVDLGFDRESRALMCARTAQLARTAAGEGRIALVAIVSPYEADRRAARELHADGGIPFLEVFLDTPLDVCRSRDPKGLYARASASALAGLTGVDDPYERPRDPDLRLTPQALDRSVTAVMDALRLRGALQAPGIVRTSGR